MTRPGGAEPIWATFPGGPADACTDGATFDAANGIWNYPYGYQLKSAVFRYEFVVGEAPAQCAPPVEVTETVQVETAAVCACEGRTVL